MITLSHESTCTTGMLKNEEIVLNNTKRHRSFGCLLLRIILVDMPLLMVFVTYATIVWFSHVHDKYLVAQLHALPFTKDMSIGATTYYKRYCSLDDMSTTRSADLFLPLDATPRDAYLHQLKHGFTVFSSVLSPDVSENLRSYILSRNQQMTADEFVSIHEQENRYSIGLGPEETTVRKALMQIGNSPTLRPALEAIIGYDPALIELAAITSTYGAKAQSLHPDVTPSGGPTMFGRTFLSSYSIFIQLQNTTKEMGATGSCPGTHFCAVGNMDEFCKTNGFQVVNEHGIWGQGDAVLMNHNSWHYGGAHTDPDGMDRVMLIVSFVPKPMVHAESRQLPDGISYSKRWDIWGFTLNDMADADKYMRRPWTYLRSLGLYKPKSASWGIDYVTGALMRSASGAGYSSTELDGFLTVGGFPFLPNWLQHFDIDWDNDESWPEFIKETKQKCHKFFENACISAVAIYLFLFSLHAIIMNDGGRRRRVYSLFLRVALMASLVFLLFQSAKLNSDQSEWAKGIIAGRRYTSTLPICKRCKNDDVGLSTMPTVNDVLIETRYGSKQLGMYNDYIALGHPGNVFFRKLIDNAAKVFGQYDENLKKATTKAVIAEVLSNHGRFLYQGSDGYWMWMSDGNHLMNHVRDELNTASTGTDLHVDLLQTTRFISSEFKYGRFRDSSLSSNHAIPHIENIKNRMIKKIVKNSPVITGDGKPIRPKFTTNLIAQSMLPSQAQFLERTNAFILPFYQKYEEPFLGAWITEGDTVETYEDDEWYISLVLFVHARGYYHVQYADRSKELVTQLSIRPFHDYQVGENVTCYIRENDGVDTCKIQKVSKDGLRFNVTSESDGRQLLLKLGDFTRRGPRFIR